MGRFERHLRQGEDVRQGFLPGAGETRLFNCAPASTPASSPAPRVLPIPPPNESQKPRAPRRPAGDPIRSPQRPATRPRALIASAPCLPRPRA
ncbi:hypothetical protein SORBI_3006G174975 [Sorghum bicolor]|uniref:Uncharacterized protein n=1 Tax=Sorghum bicolor TaxID=4558 RepID=A0A1Z5RFH5_SORBI|nr:hypothetical protein SORBI_3006G174975 [Sorghum bicolor]